MTQILIVEDEAHLAEGLRFNLHEEGFTAEVVRDGESALELLLQQRRQFAAVVLDVMLPGMDGFKVVSELRRAEHFVPVLILTARGRPEDVLKGFASGADDYLPKPFELNILIARLQGLLRRRAWSMEEVRAGSVPPKPYSFAGKTLDFDALEVRARGEVHRLTTMEAELLRFLVENGGRAISRKQILEQVWGLHEDTDTRAIDNFIVRLRRYIEDDPSQPRHLLTVRGVGYRFMGAEEPAGGRK